MPTKIFPWIFHQPYGRHIVSVVDGNCPHTTQAHSNMYLSHTCTHTHTPQVILYFSEGNPLGTLLQKRVRDTDYECFLFQSEEKVIEECLHSRHPALVVVDTDQQPVDGFSCLEHLSRLVQYSHTAANILHISGPQSTPSNWLGSTVEPLNKGHFGHYSFIGRLSLLGSWFM